jgi:hypothetical protein
MSYVNYPRYDASKEKLLDEVADRELTDVTTYNALTKKRKAVVLGTAISPDTTGWVEGTLYVIYTE